MLHFNEWTKDNGDDDYDYGGGGGDGCGSGGVCGDDYDGDYDGGAIVSNGSNYKGLLCSH